MKRYLDEKADRAMYGSWLDFLFWGGMLGLLVVFVSILAALLIVTGSMAFVAVSQGLF